MRPMMLAVCVKNMNFFPNFKESIIYALLYMSATLNEEYFQAEVFG